MSPELNEKAQSLITFLYELEGMPSSSEGNVATVFQLLAEINRLEAVINHQKEHASCD